MAATTTLAPEARSTLIARDNLLDTSMCAFLAHQRFSLSALSKFAHLPRLHGPLRSPLQSPLRFPLRFPPRFPLRCPLRSPLRFPLRSLLRSPLRPPLPNPRSEQASLCTEDSTQSAVRCCSTSPMTSDGWRNARCTDVWAWSTNGGGGDGCHQREYAVAA
eukprot:gene45612-biopygen97734